MTNLLAVAAAFYSHHASTYPYLTNAFTGFFIAAIGDMICQKYFENNINQEISTSVNNFPLNLQSNNDNINSIVSDVGKKEKSYKKIVVSSEDLRSQANHDNTRNLRIISNDIENQDSHIKNIQKHIINRFQWDFIRSLEMGTIRAVVITPFILFWYPFLVYLCPGKPFIRVVGRVVIDQLFGSPTVITMVFFAKALFRGDPYSTITNLKYQFIVTWVTGLKYWPFVHSLNFSIIPLKHRPLFAHFASLYWNAILSYYSNIKHFSPVPSSQLNQITNDNNIANKINDKKKKLLDQSQQMMEQSASTSSKKE
eukprot:gene11665-15619_t